MTRLSVIIPALNEAATLPQLLHALNHQTRKPDEIIVADAGSKDDTRQIACDHGASVVDGGLPAVGRNAGAAAATGDIFLFLDSDVLPRPTFIARALKE
ncbi:MAG: glycosyltransferase, partial [Chloroflexi bacterium]|nr:glycosyltransferase [Chloroflexota bacterium]